MTFLGRFSRPEKSAPKVSKKGYDHHWGTKAWSPRSTAEGIKGEVNLPLGLILELETYTANLTRRWAVGPANFTISISPTHITLSSKPLNIEELIQSHPRIPPGLGLGLDQHGLVD